MMMGTKKSILKQITEGLEDGKFYCIEVMEAGKPRTRGQEDRFYKICRNISEETGYTVAETKAVLIDSVFGKQRGLSDMTSQEVSILIDRGQQIQAELGIYDER